MHIYELFACGFSKISGRVGFGGLTIIFLKDMEGEAMLSSRSGYFPCLIVQYL